MPNVRTLNKDKYNISKHRFLELYHFCMQYPEWKEELSSITDTVKGIGYSEKTKASVSGSPTEKLAIRRAELERKCELIEQTAVEADPDLYTYIIRGATEEYASFRYLKQTLQMPCERDTYYDRRKKFFWLLSKKK